MSRIRRVLAFIAVSAASVLVPALPAQAGSMAGACHITGHADAAVLLVGGTGTYSFTEDTAACFLAAEGKAGIAGIATLDITSSGTFWNSVCGTGEVSDSDPEIIANVNPTSLKAKVENANLAYSITFAGFHGTLAFTDPDVSGGGDVQIYTTGIASPPRCTDGFEVVADIFFEIHA